MYRTENKGVQMYKIGEFSKIVALTVKALRYYDDIGLLSPSHVDESNGYRYYDEECYEKALQIRTMKKFGFTIKEIQDVIPNIRSNDDLSDYLMEKKEQLDSEIRSIRKLQKQLTSEVKLLEEVKHMNTEQKIEVVTLPRMKVASVRFKGQYQDVGIYLGKIFKVIGMKGISQPFSMYYDAEYTEENADIEVCVEVKGDVNKGDVNTRVLEASKCVSLVHVGPYDTLSSSYKALADYMNENKLEGITPSREQYIKGPGMLFKGNPNKYETKIMIPIK